MQTLKAVVIGAGGSIGGLKPKGIDEPGGPNILSHCHAYHAHPGTELVGVVDTDSERSLLAGEKWSCASYTDTTTAVNHQVPDVISICTPTGTHLDVIREIAKSFHSPGVIVVEKPCGQNSKECKKIARVCEDIHSELIVNYQRRFCKTFQLLRSAFLRRLEIPQAATLAYGRGLRRDGCHGLDLFRFLFGECLHIEANFRMCDHLFDDPTWGGFLRFERCPNVNMIPIDSRNYGLFDLSIWTDMGLHRFSGYTRSHAFYCREPETVMGNGYYSLGTAVVPQPQVGIETALMEMVTAAGRLATSISGPGPGCDGEGAVAVHQIMERLGGN